jgi:hypothetical protein
MVSTVIVSNRLKNRILNVGQQMYPKQWRRTLPHLEAVFRDTANQAQAVRAAALSAMSFVAPVTSPQHKYNITTEEKDEEDAREHVERVIRLLSLFLSPSGNCPFHFDFVCWPLTLTHITTGTGQMKPLKELVALTLVQIPGTKELHEQVTRIPQDLQSLLTSMGYQPSSSVLGFQHLQALNLPSPIPIVLANPDCYMWNIGGGGDKMQLRAARGVCRLVLRARGITRLNDVLGRPQVSPNSQCSHPHLPQINQQGYMPMAAPMTVAIAGTNTTCSAGCPA